MSQKYVRMAMMSVDDDYTAKSKQAGEAAKEHLKRELSNVEYRYQGSVMTDTHIKGSSDIDLLVLCTKFVNWSECVESYIDVEDRVELYYVTVAELDKFNKAPVIDSVSFVYDVETDALCEE